MPDDHSQWAILRGARPVTLRFRPPGAATTQRHAAHRIPPDHPGAHRLDQLHAAGLLDARLYANACALLALWIESGLGASAVADYQPRERSTGGGRCRPRISAINPGHMPSASRPGAFFFLSTAAFCAAVCT